MAKLAIKGNSTRGKEVIEILEMLGGRNKYHINITECNLLYTIRGGDNVIIGTYPNSDISQIYTIEDFLKKYPYKVGDRVRVPDYESEVRIDSMSWDGCEIQYQVFTDETEWYSAEELNKYNEIYKKETMDKANKVVFDTNAQCCDISNEIIKKETMENGIIYDEIDFNRYPHADKVQLILGDDYEIKVEDGKTYVVKKKLKYPKTFIECAKILDCFCSSCIDGYKWELLENLQELLICRNAYWKIAGNWKPDYNNGCDTKYIITAAENKIFPDVSVCFNYVLIFPTKEMRDAFYENFKDLIEECKELL